MTAAGEPRVFGIRVLGDEHAVEPGVLGGACHHRDPLGADELGAGIDAIRRQTDVELHTRPGVGSAIGGVGAATPLRAMACSSVPRYDAITTWSLLTQSGVPWLMTRPASRQ